MADEKPETQAERIARLDAELAAEIAAEDRAREEAEIAKLFGTIPPPPKVVEEVVETEVPPADDPAGLFSERFGAGNVMDIVDQAVTGRKFDNQTTDSNN